MWESNLVILQNTPTHLFSSYMRCLTAKLTLLMKYALLLLGILTKKQGVSSLCTALSLASFGMH